MSPRSANPPQATLDDDAPAQPGPRAATATATPPKPRAARGTRSKKSAARKPPHVLLPILVVEETLLLPHMSIPFPIEDEEAARVVDRATRTEHRHVLVLTERPVRPEPGDGVAADTADDEGELRALLGTRIVFDRHRLSGAPRERGDEHEANHLPLALSPEGETARVCDTGAKS